MLPSYAGVFHAIPTEVGITDTGNPPKATVTIRYRIYEELRRGAEPVDVSNQGWEIVGYHYLERNNGDLNERTIDSLCQSLGWDGRDTGWFETADLSEHPVQIVVEFESYEDRQRPRVQYLNPYGSTGKGGVQHGDGAALQAISNRLGAKLRAVSSGRAVATGNNGGNGTAKGTAPKPTSATSTATAVRPARATKASGSRGECSADDAWAAFARLAADKKYPTDHIESEWARIWGQLFPTKTDDSDMTPVDWHVMATDGLAMVSPF